MKSPMKSIARIFREHDGWKFSCDSLDYLDARGSGYPTKRDALEAAYRAGFTHSRGGYRSGSIRSQIKVSKFAQLEHELAYECV